MFHVGHRSLRALNANADGGSVEQLSNTKQKGNMKITYTLKVRFRDGTGHTYTKLTRQKVAMLTANQFRSGLDRPETIEITTVRPYKTKYGLVTPLARHSGLILNGKLIKIPSQH